MAESARTSSIVFTQLLKQYLLCYIIFIAITVIIQVSISIACLAVQEDREQRIIQEAWDYCEGNNLQYIHDSEAVFRCCGYDELDQRRNFSNKERFYQFERGYCIDIVEDCGNTSTINDIENDNLFRIRPKNEHCNAGCYFKFDIVFLRLCSSIKLDRT